MVANHLLFQLIKPTGETTSIPTLNMFFSVGVVMITLISFTMLCIFLNTKSTKSARLVTDYHVCEWSSITEKKAAVLSCSYLKDLSIYFMCSDQDDLWALCCWINNTHTTQTIAAPLISILLSLSDFIRLNQCSHYPLPYYRGEHNSSY